MPQDAVSSIMFQRNIDFDDHKAYAQIYKELNLDQANFYFSIKPHFYPDNINLIIDPKIRKNVKDNLNNGVSWTDMESRISNSDFITDKFESTNRIFYPKFVWHGFENQYHYWIKSFFKGTFGKSIVDGQHAFPKVMTSMLWTLSLTIPDFLLSIFLSFSLGLFMFKHRQNWFVQGLEKLLFFVYSIPSFWLATILVVYFTTDNFGNWTNIFPSIGMNIYPGESTINQILKNFHKLILPVLCLTIPSLAYIIRFLHRSLDDELKKPYVTTAISKGMSKGLIINQRVLKNALPPLITILTDALVMVFFGSLLIEVIFNIPGMGRLLYNSINLTDWNVILCIVMLMGFIVSIVYLLGDILYTLVNPKISWNA